MSQQYIFTIEALTRIYEQKEVLSNIWLSFFPGAKIGVIGDNGAGKSTLLRIMAGEDKDFMGTARPAKGIKIGYFPQEPRLEKWETVDECIQDAVSESRAILDRYNEINMKLGEDLSPEEMQELLDEQARVQDKIDHANLWELDRTLEIAADAMRLPPGDAQIAHLSGGEKRRVGLCRILLQNPDLLLLDEPTNHLDAESVAWLERFLHDFTGTVVAITHDRYFLDNVAGWILEMDRGRGYPYEGNYSGWLEQKQARLAVEEKRESKRQKVLKRELEWVRMNPRARSTKNKARLERYNELVSQDYDAREDAADIQIVPGPPLGELVDPGGKALQGVRRHAAVRRPQLRPAAGRHRRRDRPERGRQNDAVQDDHGVGAADRRRAPHRRHRVPFVRRPDPRRARTPTRPFSKRSPAAATSSKSANRGCIREPTWDGSISRGPTSRNSCASFPAASGTAFTWRNCCGPAATSCCSTSRPTTSTSKRCGRWKRPFRTSADA